MKFNPILLFCYKKTVTLKQTVTALQQCKGAMESDLIIFSDGALGEEEVNKVKEVREFLNTITGFKSISINISQKNKGLANSIIDGVTLVFEKNNALIVLEDDIVPSSNFIFYMNRALEYYEENSKVFSISGFTTPIKLKLNYEFDVYFTYRASSWGWATWKNRWMEIEWDESNLINLKKDKRNLKLLNRAGKDLNHMLNKQIQGEIDSWAIRWCYHQVRKELLTVYPIISKTLNVGFVIEASNTNQKFNRYSTYLDRSGKETFEFFKCDNPDPYYLKQFNKPFSFWKRVQFKILNSIFRK